MTSFETVLVEKDGPITLLTLNRPKALNALNHRALSDLDAAFQAAESDPATQAVIVSGAGEKSFVAGADIAEMAAFGPLEAEAHARRGQAVMDRIGRSRLVTVAAINGYALGGGLELALACDLRLASENALLGLPEVSLSVIPGFGGTQRLPRLLGPARAKELILTGRKIPASEAERLGLVNRVVPREKLLDEAKSLAREILANGPVAVRLAKEAVNDGLQTDLDRGLALEAKAFGVVFGTEDQKEGMKAFLEKRKAGWKGK